MSGEAWALRSLHTWADGSQRWSSLTPRKPWDPANSAMLENASSSRESGRKQEQIVVRSVIKKEAAGDGRVAGEEKKVKNKASSLWVKSTGCRARNRLHLITNADWSIPMAEWTSACGWAFTPRTAQISFVTDPLLAMDRCKTCLIMNKLRDEVNKGISPAQIMAADVKQLGMTHGADGCNRP